CGRFGDAIACPLVGSRRQEDSATEPLDNLPDFLIARRNVNCVQKIAHSDPAYDMLNHWAPEKASKRLAWKPRRSHPRWNNCDDPNHDPPAENADLGNFRVDLRLHFPQESRANSMPKKFRRAWLFAAIEETDLSGSSDT